MAAKVRPALPLTGTPADDELDLISVVLHTAALWGNCRGLPSRSRFSNRGLHRHQIQTVATVKLAR
jgi:hypothetical protein